MPMIAAILGFIPALERRRSIAIRSGSAAKVVPNPATSPRISERLKVGKSKLCVSRGMRSEVSGPRACTAAARQTVTRIRAVATLLNCLIYPRVISAFARGPDRSGLEAARPDSEYQVRQRPGSTLSNTSMRPEPAQLSGFEERLVTQPADSKPRLWLLNRPLLAL